MNRQDFQRLLSPFVDRPSSDLEDVGEDPDCPIAAPFENFFGDSLLLLVFHSKDVLPADLDTVRDHLRTVVSASSTEAEKAMASLKIGRFVRGSCPTGGTRSDQRASPWFKLAIKYECIEGAIECANDCLTAKSLKIEESGADGLVPLLLQSEGENRPLTDEVPKGACQAWESGLRIALRRSGDSFAGWDGESYRAALECCRNYFSFLPDSSSASQRGKALANRKAALRWGVPLWNQLIEKACESDRGLRMEREDLVECQRAVLLTTGSEATVGSRRLEREQTDKVPSGSEFVVVIKGVIPASSDRDDAAILKLYQSLRRPVKLQALPDLRMLNDVRERLCMEFPWAMDAVEATMAEIFARKMHGSRRLGMQPVLLVGAPGTGKTRFAQRLSDLLGTPNTLINMSGMTDVKVLKGVTRGWSSNRPSRIVEFIQQHAVANPLFILDEVDKALGYSGGNGGDPQDALLDLLEPGNAKRYSDIYLMCECDVSHAMYVLTANSLEKLSEPLKSRLRIVYFPSPGPEHSGVIVKGIVRDLENAWNVPADTITLEPSESAILEGLSPREVRRAILEFLGKSDRHAPRYRLQ